MSGYAGNEAYLNMQESINMQSNYYNSDVEYTNLQTQQLGKYFCQNFMVYKLHEIYRFSVFHRS